MPLLNQATFSPLAHGGGAIHGRIAGNVTNSIISVSVDPNPSGINNPGQFQNVTSKTFPFGAPDNIVLPRGVLSVKVEGAVEQQRDPARVDGSPNPLGLPAAAVDPNIAPTSAFFAKTGAASSTCRSSRRTFRKRLIRLRCLTT